LKPEFCPFGTNSGAGAGNRTPDLRITSALLYRLSYPGEDPLRTGSKPREVIQASVYPPGLGGRAGREPDCRWPAYGCS
jgi:hypothetical protein